MVARGRGKLFKGHRVSVGGDEKVLEMMVVMVAHQSECI